VSSNAVHYAGASRVDVSVRELDGRVELIVEDDGRGFDVQSHRTGFGLIGMQERVDLEHGTLRVISEPGEGTRAEATLPVRRRPSAAGLLRRPTSTSVQVADDAAARDLMDDLKLGQLTVDAVGDGSKPHCS
jgi:hypothetical protein